MIWWHDLLHAFGILPRTPSTAYNWWSGAGSDLGELAIVAGLVHMARAATCHQKGCWRIGRHPVGDGTIRVCGRHHPAIDGPITAAHVLAAHVGTRDANKVSS